MSQNRNLSSIFNSEYDCPHVTSSTQTHEHSQLGLWFNKARRHWELVRFELGPFCSNQCLFSKNSLCTLHGPKLAARSTPAVRTFTEVRFKGPGTQPRERGGARSTRARAMFAWSRGTFCSSGLRCCCDGGLSSSVSARLWGCHNVCTRTSLMEE
ncbi:hypothetical protein DFH06DRAFT_282640 [Mycena polygramma]|nr:hypothetical protein DFH06DRAFT_282640 [Mycena polygramma]